jgi:hypothetical protein
MRTENIRRRYNQITKRQELRTALIDEQSDAFLAKLFEDIFRQLSSSLYIPNVMLSDRREKKKGAYTDSTDLLVESEHDEDAPCWFETVFEEYLGGRPDTKMIDTMPELAGEYRHTRFR